MTARLRIVAVFGTRPEAIKVLPVVRALRERRDRFECVALATSQHRALLQQALAAFEVAPDVDLDVMTRDQTLAGITTRVLGGLDRYLSEHPADMVLVQGDTTTTLSAALAAFYRGMKVGHIEAGLRTFDRRSPFPEEINRRLTSQLADLHFAPSPGAAENLRREGVPAEAIAHTGNPGIDALQMALVREHPLPEPIARAVEGKRVVLLTLHRRENHGPPLREALSAARELIAARPDTCLIYPVHPNPRVHNDAHEILSGRARIHLTEPLDYLDFVHLMRRSHLLLTDSGGLQEEAPALGRPVLVLRDETERPEAVAAGTARLVGCHRSAILHEAGRLLDDATAWEAMSRAHNPYGDGSAAPRIVDAIERFFEIAAGTRR